MVKFADPSQNTQNMKKNELLTTITSMKVLVVDYKTDLVAYVAKVLQSFSFEVTCLHNSGAALRLLLQKSNQFDLLLIDRNMSDVDIYTFLRITKNMGLLSVVMSEQEDDDFIHEVIKIGAFLVVKSPITIDAVKHLRQDVIRNRMHKHENNSSEKGKECEPQTRVHRSSSSDNDFINDHGCLKKKRCIVWTAEIRARFDYAVELLGEGNCFPKKILELMDVPGLTRMQVASHLQKRRKEKLKFEEKQRTQNHEMPTNPFPQGLNVRVYGSLPSLQTNQKEHEENNALIGMNLPVNGWQTEVSQTGTSMMNIPNQENIAQQTEYTQFPFGSEQTISGQVVAGQGSHDQNLSSIPWN